MHEGSVDVPDMQEVQIIHDAAKVLRGSLHTVEISKDLYPSPYDLSHHRSLQFIPPTLSLLTFDHNSITVMILKPCL
jgi:hypothetical protein